MIVLAAAHQVVLLTPHRSLLVTNLGILAVLLWSFGRPIDTYARQSLDVEHYHFAIELSDTTDRIIGTTTIRMRMLAAGVRTVALDLSSATAERKRGGIRRTHVLL